MARYLGKVDEDLIVSALAHASRRGAAPVCVVLSFSKSTEDIRALLRDPRVASIGVKDQLSVTGIPADLSEDPRIGSYWETGEWRLPVPATDVYFVGSGGLLTVAMLREAIRCEVAGLRVRVAGFWVPVPLDPLRSFGRLPVPVRAIILELFRAARRLSPKRVLARLNRFGASSVGKSVPPISLETAFDRMLSAAQPLSGSVPGRIVHVCGNLQPGGAERQLVHVLGGLARQNLESVRLLCHSLRPETSDRRDFHLAAVRAIGIEAREIRRRPTALVMPAEIRDVANAIPSGLLVDIVDLYWEFVEIKPEVVHAWLDWDNVRSGLAAAFAGVPRIVLSGRNLNPSHFALYQPYMDSAYRVLARRDNVTLVNNSRAGADDYADWIGISRARIRVIHNGVDSGPLTHDSNIAAKVMRKQLGIPDNAFVVGGVFRFEAEKRPLLWIETAALVARHVPDAWFVVFGQGSLREQMQVAARRAGFEQRLTMPGLTNDVPSVMSGIDVLLLTSFGEGLPNVILEAQSNGTPVVTTDVGGAREAIDPDGTGWAIRSDRADDLAQRIVWLYAHPDVRSAVRERGPAFVRQHFGVERMVRETAALYETTGGLTELIARAQENSSSGG